ncbi:MAG: hypothetical protein JOZ81_03820, partial [Chloroflexi bacterium]|nr:hypothetical protein [Chloroflexota bacterium]
TALLRQRSIDFDLSDSHVSRERLAGYDAIFVQSAEFFDPLDLTAIVQHARNVVLGPMRPTLDAYLRPYEGFPQARVVATERLDQAVDELAPPDFEIDPPAEVVPHTDGRTTLLFLSNPTDAEIRTRLRCRNARRFESVWGDAAPTDALELTLPPYTVNIWRET